MSGKIVGRSVARCACRLLKCPFLCFENVKSHFYYQQFKYDDDDNVESRWRRRRRGNIEFIHCFDCRIVIVVRCDCLYRRRSFTHPQCVSHTHTHACDGFGCFLLLLLRLIGCCCSPYSKCHTYDGAIVNWNQMSDCWCLRLFRSILRQSCPKSNLWNRSINRFATKMRRRRRAEWSRMGE